MPLDPNDHYRYLDGGTTSRLLMLQWSQLGQWQQRKQAFGGRINGWGVQKVAHDLYLIPNSVTIEAIHSCLLQSLEPHDRATLVYPHGSTGAGSSAMRVRRYGRAATGE